MTPKQPATNVEAVDASEMNRREFLSTTAAIGGAMVLGFWLPPASAEAAVPVAAQPWYRDPMVPEINWGYDDAMYQETTVRNGAAVERNFDLFPVSRMNEYPKQLNIEYFKTNKWLYGAGEETIVSI